MVGAFEGDATLVHLHLGIPQAELVHPTVEQTQLQPNANKIQFSQTTTEGLQ
jgi:hypothetical protein